MAEEECTHECGSCGVAGCGDREDAGPSTFPTNARTNIKHVIGVVSGKGGVGKSLVTSLLASQMQKKGFSVGILDADVTGPSIPKTFGITNPLTADADGIVPAQTASGIKVVSVNLMLPKDDIPVAWRGPVVSGIIKQFWGEVSWGDIDYLFVDMPPGTSDVFLTVFQSLPVDGIVTVSALQELVAMIVGKAVNLAHDLKVPVVGLVENMALQVRRVRQEPPHLRRAPGRGRGSATRDPRSPRCPSTRRSRACATRARWRSTTWPARSTRSSSRLRSARRRRTPSRREAEPIAKPEGPRGIVPGLFPWTTALASMSARGVPTHENRRIVGAKHGGYASFRYRPEVGTGPSATSARTEAGRAPEHKRDQDARRSSPSGRAPATCTRPAR